MLVDLAFICAAAIFLLFAGENVSRWIRDRRKQPADPRAWIDQRITNERDPGKRASWRTIRDREKEEQL